LAGFDSRSIHHHAADALAGMHQVEGGFDLGERRSGLMSTPMILSAPASRSLWMTLRPMPPGPNTMQFAPASTLKVLSTAPPLASRPRERRAGRRAVRGAAIWAGRWLPSPASAARSPLSTTGGRGRSGCGLPKPGGARCRSGMGRTAVCDWAEKEITALGVFNGLFWSK
jgi:hypothetical protein